MIQSYQRPDSLRAALAHLADGDCVIAAGCTDLFPATERKILPGPILDISAVAELRGISREAGGLRIGATTTWAQIASADLPPACLALQQAAKQVGAHQIQNRASLAGNLCNASPAADGVPALLVLDAEVELTSMQGVRRMALSEFITGPRQPALPSDELLSAIYLPDSALLGRSDFQKLGARAYLVISIAMSAVRLVLRDGVISEVAISIGACGPVATRLSDLEAALIGQVPSADLITAVLVTPALAPIEDVRGDVAYRLEAGVEILRRSFMALERAE